MSDDRVAFYESLFRAAETDAERELIYALARENGEKDVAKCGLMRSSYAKEA